jgi:hypothetical protein
MTDDRSLERAARSWLDEGPTQAPDHAVQAALAQINTTRQERDLWIPWRLRSMNAFTRLAAGIAAIAVLAVAGVMLTRSGAGPGAAPTPSPTPSPTAVPTAAPSGSPAANACRFITTTEAATLTEFKDIGALATPVGTGASTGCHYTAGNMDTVLDVAYTNPGGRAAFGTVKVKAGV